MPETLTTAQAIDRARWIIESGHKLTQSVQTVTEAQGETARNAAAIINDEALLGYRVVTVPVALAPVLEALIRSTNQ